MTRSSEAVLKVDKRAAPNNVLNDDDELEANFYNLCPSWMGQVFQVTYSLKIYLKHDSFFERGQGECVNMPIRIMANPMLNPSTEPWRIPANWNPYAGTTEPTYVYLENAEAKPDYITRFIERNWQNWEKNVQPMIMTLEAEQASRARRKTMKMNDEDPDNAEESKGQPQQAQ